MGSLHKILLIMLLTVFVIAYGMRRGIRMRSAHGISPRVGAAIGPFDGHGYSPRPGSEWSFSGKVLGIPSSMRVLEKEISPAAVIEESQRVMESMGMPFLKDVSDTLCVIIGATEKETEIVAAVRDPYTGMTRILSAEFSGSPEDIERNVGQLGQVNRGDMQGIPVFPSSAQRFTISGDGRELLFYQSPYSLGRTFQFYETKMTRMGWELRSPHATAGDPDSGGRTLLFQKGSRQCMVYLENQERGDGCSIIILHQEE